MNELFKTTGVVIPFFAVLCFIFAPYINHIVWCIQQAEYGWQPIALLVVGVIFVPVGWLHGLVLFFGFTWI